MPSLLSVQLSATRATEFLPSTYVGGFFTLKIVMFDHGFKR